MVSMSSLQHILTYIPYALVLIDLRYEGKELLFSSSSSPPLLLLSAFTYFVKVPLFVWVWTVEPCGSTPRPCLDFVRGSSKERRRRS